MSATSFIESVKKWFAFLLEEFGFVVAYTDYNPAMMGNAIVRLASSAVVVDIVKDRGQVLISIGKAPMPSDEWLEFTDVVRYFASDESLDVYQFGENPYDPPPIETQLSRSARLARQYCTPILGGDFSMIEGIRRLERNRLEELLRGSTKS